MVSRKTKKVKKTKVPLIKKHGAMVLALGKTPVAFRKKILKEAPKELINCVAECSHNVLKGNVPLSPAQKRKLRPKRQQLRLLADKKVSIQKKKKVLNQQGGFLPLLALAPSLAPVVGNVLSELVRKI